MVVVVYSRQQERLVAMLLHGQRAWLGGHSTRSANTLVSRITHGVSGSATDPHGLCRVFKMTQRQWGYIVAGCVLTSLAHSVDAGL